MTENYMLQFTTLAGMTLDAVLMEFMRVLPAEAYKDIGGPLKLTDVKPAWLDETLTKCFGPMGVGWYYTQTMERLPAIAETKRDGTPTNRTLNPAQVLNFELFYYYFDTLAGQWKWSKPIQATGYSDNEDIGYSMKGATTNALGIAMSKLLWQIGVYKGKINAENAGKSTGYTRSLWDVTPPKKEEPKKEVKAEVKTEPAKVATPAPSLTPDPATGEVKTDVVVIPGVGGIPDSIAGQALATVDMNDPTMRNVVNWLAGKGTNSAGKTYASEPTFDSKVQGIALRLANAAEKKAKE